MYILALIFSQFFLGDGSEMKVKHVIGTKIIEEEHVQIK